MKLSGKITQVMPLQQGTSQQGAQWRKLTIVVMEDDASIAYPNTMLFDLFNDKIPETALTAGQHVDVHFGVRTREYNGRIYNDVNVVKFTIQNS
jgi:hypothetical protein